MCKRSALNAKDSRHQLVSWLVARHAEAYRVYQLSDLCHGVAAVDTDVSTRHVAGRLAEEIDDGAHEIFRFAHLADRDERGPVLV